MASRLLKAGDRVKWNSKSNPWTGTVLEDQVSGNRVKWRVDEFYTYGGLYSPNSGHNHIHSNDQLDLIDVSATPPTNHISINYGCSCSKCKEFCPHAEVKEKFVCYRCSH